MALQLNPEGVGEPRCLAVGSEGKPTGTVAAVATSGLAAMQCHLRVAGGKGRRTGFGADNSCTPHPYHGLPTICQPPVHLTSSASGRFREMERETSHLVQAKLRAQLSLHSVHSKGTNLCHMGPSSQNKLAQE